VEGLFFWKNPTSGSGRATYALKGRIVNLTPEHQWPSMVLALDIAAYCTSSYVYATARLEGSLGTDATEFEYDLGFRFPGDCTFLSVSGTHQSGLSKLTKLKAKREAAERKAFLSKFPLLFNGMPLVFLGSDRKCAQQFIEAAAMEGLEKRKRFAELISFGCGVTVNSPTRVRIIQKDRPYALVEVIDGQSIGQKGWVPDQWLQSPEPIQIQQH